jgi:hypothetical protein
MIGLAGAVAQTLGWRSVIISVMAARVLLAWTTALSSVIAGGGAPGRAR